MSRIALIAGVTGIVGNNLAQQLLSNGWQVHGLARRSSADLAFTQRAADQDGVASTPTLFINGKRVENTPQTPAELDAAIAAAAKGGR